MKCIILAAGYATRLYPLTENFPKPLLEVCGKTILDRLIDDISSSGDVDEFVTVTNHKFAPHFERWAEGRNNITVADDGTTSNENRLGAVRDIWFAAEKCGINNDCMVIAGDNVLDFSLTRFIDYFKQKKHSCVMRYYEPDTERIKKGGCLVLGEGDAVSEMQEKSPNPKSHWCCPPFYIYTAEDLKRIPEALADGAGFDAPGSFVSWLCRKAEMYAMEMPGSRYDIGDIKSYENVQKTYKGIVK